jgi:FkbM family methyltransferase
MSDALADLLRRSPLLRRLAWRAGRRLYCAARGELYRNRIAENGEAYVQRCAVAALAPRETLTAFDIGAHEGEWSLSLLEALVAGGRAAAVLRAFEPSAAARARLEAALAAHPLGALVAIEEIALSDAIGSARLAVMCEQGGTNTLHAAGEPPGGFVEVETCDLSSYCRREGVNHVHLVKCDAEGHDPHVLRGALDLLREERVDAFQFEYNHRWAQSRYFLKDVFDLITGLPYEVARIVPDGLEILPGWHFELERFFEANYLLVRRPALDWFACRRGRFDAHNAYV